MASASAETELRATLSAGSVARCKLSSMTASALTDAPISATPGEATAAARLLVAFFVGHRGRGADADLAASHDVADRALGALALRRVALSAAVSVEFVRPESRASRRFGSLPVAPFWRVISSWRAS